jgi:hypothetical protein
MSSLHQKYQDHYTLFIETGFIAVNQMDTHSALALFKAAKHLDADNPMSELGMAYYHLCRLEITPCLNCVNHVLKKDPHHQMALAFKAMAQLFSTSQVKEGKKILEELKTSSDANVKKFSEQGLEFMEKFVNKQAR